MPSKRNRKSKVLAKSRNFREKKDQAKIEHESDGSFSDDEFQPEPFRSSRTRLRFWTASQEK